ncbi:MAG TPA: F0F1 ATP synthase subunit delta, partial [Stellaceae bacterium]|nr:F0F1 ATP synthase subunit delta [Stellaceae bacterium]
MASESAGVSGLAERYAAALFDLADERKELDAVADDLKALRGLVAESADLRRMIRSPALARDHQAKAVAALAERAGLKELTHNFLGLLARNRRLF